MTSAFRRRQVGALAIGGARFRRLVARAVIAGTALDIVSILFEPIGQLLSANG
jgi:hypothetical protein